MSAAPPTQRTKCRSCKADIWWGLTSNGKRIPVDPRPNGAGNIVVIGHTTDETPIVHALGREELGRAGRLGHLNLYLSHFVTCHHADDWRLRR